MSDNGIVSACQAQHYSHPHLTPKKDGLFRFNIDFRYLNLASKGLGWPLPNIEQTIQRLGAKKPKIFGKIDLTAGYHQMPISLASRIFTAFITFMGVYMWNRVPMGLKGAAAYFQKVLATVVLVGLIYHICELYLDDILIYGQTEDEFLYNLEEVYKRLEKHRLTANPDKVLLGMPEVEYVGHLINEHGTTFERARLDKVLDIPEPIFGKQLKSFLGVVVYFHAHIQAYSMMVKPLHQMILNYEKAKNIRLTWTAETSAAFNNIREAINRLPMLFFLDGPSEIYVTTDASKYGIGAYCWQMRGGAELPIAFMSRALDVRESRWDTRQKECFAIIVALRKFAYLLRDRKFVLRTDHKNLIYMNTDQDAKVVRWKMEISEYDCFIEHIPGETNIIADGFSRVLPGEPLNEENAAMEQMYILPDDEDETDRPHVTGPQFIARAFAELLPGEEEVLAARYGMEIPDREHEWISECHNSRVGHHGHERTVQQVQANGHRWQYMREHVKSFIKNCPFCQKMSYIKVPIHTHPYTVATYAPMERLAIDAMGPFPVSTTGTVYILCVICCFTRWVELYALKDLTMEEARRVLKQHFGRYGTPGQIISDPGTQFKNGTVKELFNMIGTQHITTLAYSKEENSLVERANLESMRHMRAIIYDKNIIEDWEDNLPTIQRICNTSWNESNSVSPADLLFGRAIKLDRRLYLDQTELPPDTIATLSIWAAKRLQTQDQLLKMAEQTQRERDASHIARADPRRTEYAIGDYVLVNYHENALRRGPPNKFLPFLRGPLQVIRRTPGNPDEYTLLNLVMNKEELAHITDIRPFYYDPRRLDPRDAALRDVASLFVVERILAHTGDTRNRGAMDFKVRWAGYGPDNDRWLPYKELARNEAALEYFWANRLKVLIPADLRVGAYQ
jgi:cleavage and polyadenylation specificity factor subunit 1